ncbi:hypothetical protein POCGH01_00100900 [Plasmodium ovale]|uniref:Transmembrane protein n=1 Tax=Plasmodium ovale TaxID=36330 RepID=A0A1D3JC80_PLAOA|nr:hypothetical protein POCGH01_00100900 [Plasmodium ovale]
MKINNKKSNNFPEKCKKFIAQQPNDENNILCVKGNEICRDVTKKFKNFKHGAVQDNFQFKLFSLQLNPYYNNFTSNFSILIGLNQLFILILLFVHVSFARANASNPSQMLQESEESKTSFFSDPGGYIINHFNCVMKGDQTCLQLTFLIIFLVGAVLSALGVMYKYLCKCCACCCPKKKVQVDYREKFEQMQQEQEELRKVLMEGQYFDRDKMGFGDKKDKDDRDDKNDKHHKHNDDDKYNKYDKNDRDDKNDRHDKNEKYNEKNNDSSNGTSEPRMKKSQSETFNIGYQKFQQ